MLHHLNRFTGLVARHETALWWLHSLYALAFGIGVMWLGSRNYEWLRLTVFYVAFLWATSLIVPSLVDLPEHPTKWRGRVRLLLNYFSKNFYQQVLFFLLPVYWASATFGSANMLFVFFLAVSAVLSTLDVFYDRHISVRRSLAAVFFGFNLFACINVILPTVWRIGHRAAMPVSALLAIVAFATVRSRLRDLRRPHGWVPIVLSGALLAGTLMWGRSFIPPAPLRLASAEFGPEIDRRSLQIVKPFSTIEPDFEGRVYALTAIVAPLGLEDRVAHVWFRNDARIHASPYYTLQGGRTEGFRLWTHHTFRSLEDGDVLRVDVRTETGQLVGRTWIDVAPSDACRVEAQGGAAGVQLVK